MYIVIHYFLASQLIHLSTLIFGFCSYAKIVNLEVSILVSGWLRVMEYKT